MTYYVATLSSYVLVEASNPDEARAKGHESLHALVAEMGQRQDAPITIKTVRPATADEVELVQWHNELNATENAR